MTYRGEYRNGRAGSTDTLPQTVPQSRGNVRYVTPRPSDANRHSDADGSCAWPRRGLPAGAYVDSDGRVRGACECECGCRRTERRYRRCERCGAGRHTLPQSAPIPLAARAAMSFGLWGDKPPTAEVLRARLDTHLRLMAPDPSGREDRTDAKVRDTTRSGSLRRLAAD